MTEQQNATAEEVVEQRQQDEELQQSLTTVSTTVIALEKIKSGLAELRKQHPLDIVVDVSTKAGMDRAVAARAAYRRVKVEVEDRRKTAKAPILALGRRLDAFAGELTEQLQAGQDFYDKPIKDEERRKEEERAARQRAEELRIAEIREQIADINAVVVRAVNLSSADIQKKLDMITRLEISDAVFQELKAEAIVAKAEALTKLSDLKLAAVEREGREERARLDREELERRRAAEQVVARHDDFLLQVQFFARGIAALDSGGLARRIDQLTALEIPAGLGHLEASARKAVNDTIDEITALLHVVAIREQHEREDAQRRAQEAEAMQAIEALNALHAKINAHQPHQGSISQVEALIAQLRENTPLPEDFGPYYTLAAATHSNVLKSMERALEIARVTPAPSAPADQPPNAQETGFVPETSGPYASNEPEAAQGSSSGAADGAHAEERAPTDTRPEIKTSEIQERFGFPISGGFIETTLGVAPSRTKDRARWWPAADWEEICDRLVAHVTEAKVRHA